MRLIVWIILVCSVSIISAQVQTYKLIDIEEIYQTRPQKDKEASEEVLRIYHFKTNTGERFSMAQAFEAQDYFSRQSPETPIANIEWDENPELPGLQASFSSYEAAQAAYDNGKRQEEIQLDLEENILGNTVLPSGSQDEMAESILNGERLARNGVDYGSGPVVSLAFEDYEYNIDSLSHGHAQNMLDNNYFSHTDTEGYSSFARIDNNNAIGKNACDGDDGHEFLARGENIAGFWTSSSSNPLPILRAIYNWVYDNGPGWGHRDGVLIGDVAYNGSNGFDDNYGEPGKTGFFGIATDGRDGGTYNPFEWSWVYRGDVVVFNIFDPVDILCDYQPGVSGVSGIVPVEYVSFDVSKEEKGNQINWSVYELNTSHYNVEYSSDGNNWNIAQTIPANSNPEINTYNFLHKSMHRSIYYRIKSIDYDGFTMYSKIKYVQRESSKSLSIYPTVVTSELNINGFEKGSIYKIESRDGRDIMKGDAQSILDCENLVKGIYYISIINNTKVESLSFIKI